jgi:hypothetical protein
MFAKRSEPDALSECKSREALSDTGGAMGKVKVLFLASDPFKQNALGLDEEIRAITARLRAAEHRDTVDLISAWAVRPEDLQALLLQHKPQVVHFSGHGTDDAELVLKDQNGQAKPISTAALVGLFRALRDNVRLVVLNACHSEPQARAIVDVIDCAVGMNTAIADDAAISFAGAFYQALGYGRSVKEAFELGKNQLLLDGIPEEATPALRHARNVDPAKIRLVGP